MRKESAHLSPVVDDAATTEEARRLVIHRLIIIVYILALLVALSVWFLAIRAPLWLDETSSYWSISGGFKQIWTRTIKVNSFPTYGYILWFTTAVLGSKEIVLRIPSLLAMLAAMYIFYRCARELFVREIALVATVLFVLDSRVVFAAIDVRPYPFAMLFTVAAIFCFLRWLKTQNIHYAALFGIASAGIFYFHYLFGVCMVAAFAVAYFLEHWRSPFGELKQMGVAAACFALFIIPVLTRLWDVQQRRNQFIFTAAPAFKALLRAIGPGVVPYVVLDVIFVAALTRKLSMPNVQDGRQFMRSATLGLVPAATLYVVSVMTPLHIFIGRYQAVAVPGIALAWAWLFGRIDSRLIRVLGCGLIVAWSAYFSYTLPEARNHGYTWKYALEFADAQTGDGSPILICSDYPDADFRDMPAESALAKDSDLFAPLSYYKVRTSVVPMPRALNAQAQAIGRRFYLRTAINHRRFLAVCFRPSYPTLQWLVNLSSVTHQARVLADFDGIAVVEFAPRDERPGSY